MANDATEDIYDYLRLLERAPEAFRRSWDAIVVYDLEGRIVLGNAVARAMVGSGRASELQGLHFTSHLTLEEATKAARDFAQCVTYGRTVERHSVFVDGSGQSIPVRLRLVPARLRGHIVGVSSVAGYRGLPWMPGYSASKAALTAYLEGLRPALKRGPLLLSNWTSGDQ